MHEAVKAKANICTIVKKYQRSKFFNLLNYEKPKKSLWKSVNFFKNKSDLPVAQEAVFADMATAILKTETIVHVPISGEQTFISALKLIFDINADKLEHDKNCAGLYQQLSLIEAEIKDLKENPLLHCSIMEDRLAEYLEGMYMAVAAETKNTVSSSSYNFYITIKKHFLNYLPVLPEKNLFISVACVKANEHKCFFEDLAKRVIKEEDILIVKPNSDSPFLFSECYLKQFQPTKQPKCRY